MYLALLNMLTGDTVNKFNINYLYNAVEELNSGLPRINPVSDRVEDLKQGPPDFKFSAVNHSATPHTAKTERQIIHIAVHAFDHEYELLCCFSIIIRRQICRYTLYFLQAISHYVISCTVFTPCQKVCAP